MARLAFTARESSFNWIKGDGRAAFLRKPKLSRRFFGNFIENTVCLSPNDAHP